MPIKSNVCFLTTSGEVLLAMKKRGFGVGKWNGVGGKAKDGENIRRAALREIEEEIGVKPVERYLKNTGLIKFRFKGKKEWDQDMTVYRLLRWEGKPVESEEMKPEWYNSAELPYESMWVDDPIWLPKVLAGEKVFAWFLFEADGKRLSGIEFTEVLFAILSW